MELGAMGRIIPQNDRTFGRKPYAAVFLLGLMLVAVACGSEVAPPDSSDAPTPIPATATPDPNSDALLPDDWIRTQVRAGLIGRHTSNPLVGFTIVLPPEWVVGESWADQDITNGWFAAPPTTAQGGWHSISYSIGYDPNRPAQALNEDPRYQITEFEILGVKAAFRFGAPGGEKVKRFDAYFERIPGAPDGVVAPRLDLRWSTSDFGFEDSEQLEQVLRSIRYEELTSLPDTPTPAVTASNDWVRKIAGEDGGDDEVFYGGSFSLRLPPGWTTTERNGVDGAIGTIVGDGIRLSYNNPMPIPVNRPPSSGSHSNPTYFAWEEFNDGLVIALVRPVSPIPDHAATTGVMIHPFYEGPEAGFYTKYIKMSVLGKGLDGDQQETELAIFRTIEARPEIATPAYRPVPR